MRVIDWCRKEFPHQADAAYRLLRLAHVTAQELQQYGDGWRQYVADRLAGSGKANLPDHDYSPRRRRP